MEINYEKIRSETEGLVNEAVHLREEALLSQKQVATILGLSSHGSVNAIETKKTVPRLDTFLKLLAVYGYTLKVVPDETKKSSQ